MKYILFLVYEIVNYIFLCILFYVSQTPSLVPKAYKYYHFKKIFLSFTPVYGTKYLPYRLINSWILTNRHPAQYCRANPKMA